MTFRRRKFLLCFLLLSFLIYGIGNLGWCDTIVDYDITENATWTEAGSPYIVTKMVTIKSPIYNQDYDAGPYVKLTIEPGVVVKFEEGAGLKVGVGRPGEHFHGALYAKGTKEKPIIFTSNSNDPQPGDWKGIYFTCDTINRESFLGNCTIKYAGAEISAADRVKIKAGILCEKASPTISNCTIINTMGDGIALHHYYEGWQFSAPLIEGCVIANNTGCGINVSEDRTAHYPTIIDNIFKNNGSYPIRIGGRFEIHGNTYINNGIQAINIFGNKNEDDPDPYHPIIPPREDVTWNKEPVPYIVTGDVNFASKLTGEDNYATLTIEPGTEIRFASGTGIIIGDSNHYGALIAQGTKNASITFTANGTNSTAGAWKGITLSQYTISNQTFIEHSIIEYADKGIFCNGGKAKIQYNNIRNNKVGIYLQNDGADNTVIKCNNIIYNNDGIYTTDGAEPDVQNNNFEHNTEYGINNANTSGNLTAENNWWNNVQGPNHEGDRITDNVDAIPFLTSRSTCINAPPSNLPPKPPRNPNPEDNATNVSTNATLSWDGGDPNPWDSVVYDLYFGPSENELDLIAGNLTDTSYQVTNLTAGAEYFWKVVSRDQAGEETEGDVWRFITKGDPPDLNSTEIVFDPDPSTLNDGQTLTINATIKNSGAGPCVNSFVVDFKVDGSSIGTVTVSDSILSGESITVSKTWESRGGNHQIEVVADKDNQVNEPDENNNSRSSNISIPAPDLTVQDITWSAENPVDGDSVTINATIQNDSTNYTTKDFRVVFKVDGEEVGHSDISGIEANGEKTASITWTATPGNHTIIAEVDSTDVVGESNETNNFLSKDMGEIPYPNLVLAELNKKTENVVTGKPVKFTARIENQGAGSTHRSFKVRFWMDDNTLDTRTISGIDSGNSTEISIFWDAEEGDHTLNATVDYENRVQESNETDNSKTYTLENIPSLPSVDEVILPDTGGNPWAGTKTISWQTSASGNNTVKSVNLYICSHTIERLIAEGLSEDGSYDWNTRYALDGVRVNDGEYRLKIVVTDSSGAENYYYSDWFKICNTPQLKLDSTQRTLRVLPNEEGNYTIFIKNYQESPDTFNISIDNQDGADVAEINATEITLGAWEEGTVKLTVSGETPGNFYDVVVSVVSRSNPDDLSKSIRTRTIILPYYEVEISPSTYKTSCGANATFTVTLKNHEKQIDTFHLAVVGAPANENNVIYEKDHRLSAGETKTIPLRLEDINSAGDHTITVIATSDNYRSDAQNASSSLSVQSGPIISHIYPGMYVGTRDVTFHWETSTHATSKLYLKKQGDSEYTIYEGEPGLVHNIQVTDLERYTTYKYYVESTSTYGTSQSVEKQFKVISGIEFGENTYSFEIKKDYNQELSGIIIKNTDSEPHEVSLSIVNAPEDLAIGFVGIGEDEGLLLAPHSSFELKLFAHAQDSEKTDYNFGISVTTKDEDEELKDYAEVHLTIDVPNIDFTVEEVDEDPRTLEKTIKITNKGDPITDLNVSLSDDLKGKVSMSPKVTHGYLNSDDFNVEIIKLKPVLDENFQTLNGTLKVKAYNVVKTLDLTFQVPEGKKVYVMQNPDKCDGNLTEDNLDIDVIELTDTRMVADVWISGQDEPVRCIIEKNQVSYSPTQDEIDAGDEVYDLFDENGNVKAFSSSYENGNFKSIFRGIVAAGSYDEVYSEMECAKRVYNAVSSSVNTYRNYSKFQNYIDNSGYSDNVKRDMTFGNTAATFFDACSSVARTFGLDSVADYFDYAARAIRNATRIIGKRNQQLEDAYNMLNEVMGGHSFYCTNRPAVDSDFDVPDVDPEEVYRAHVGINFSPSKKYPPKPHDVHIYLNGELIKSFIDTIPFGYYIIDFDPWLLNYGRGGSSSNRLSFRMGRMSPGHYAVIYDFLITLELGDPTMKYIMPVIGDENDNGTEARENYCKVIKKKYRKCDFVITESGINLDPRSPVKDKETTISATVTNRGSAGGNVLIALYINDELQEERLEYLDHFERKTYDFSWTPDGTGDYTIEVKLTPISHDRDEGNNNASVTVTIKEDTQPPVIKSPLPLSDSTTSDPTPFIGASYSDETGINKHSVVIRLDGEDITSSSTVTSKQVYYNPPSPLDDGNHTVSVYAEDIKGNSNTYTWKFEINTQTPEIFNLEVESSSETNATIVWETSQDCDSLIDYGTSSGNYTNSRSYDDYVRFHKVILSGLSPNTTYYFKVTSVNEYGQQVRSDEHTFYTGSNHPPNEPNDPSPSDGELDVNVNPTLQWSGGDPDNDSVEYDLYLGTNPDPPIYKENITNTNYTVTGLTEGTTYYWKIVARDSKGVETQSGVWSFTTQGERETGNRLPYEPSDPYPEDNTILNALEVQLHWSGGDPDPDDTVTYDLYFGTTPEPPLLASSLNSTSYEVTGLSGSTTYYWKVIATDNHGAQSASRTWVFKTYSTGDTGSSGDTDSIEDTGVPGDCNGNGETSIDEVQKAINCFLGIQNSCCDMCDFNSNGQVTIEEVQKVINAFLGN